MVLRRATVLFGVLLGVAPLAKAQIYFAFLDGPSESPPNASPATGFTLVTLDTSANTMRVEVTFTGLLAANTASHIHAPTTTPFTGTAGVATTTPTFTGFPTGTTSGVYDHTFDMLDAGSYNASFVTANGGTAASAWAAFQTFVAQGRSYLNIHTSQFPGGEIRGFLRPVPEPATLTALGGFLLAGVLRARRRRNS